MKVRNMNPIRKVKKFSVLLYSCLNSHLQIMKRKEKKGKQQEDYNYCNSNILPKIDNNFLQLPKRIRL